MCLGFFFNSLLNTETGVSGRPAPPVRSRRKSPAMSATDVFPDEFLGGAAGDVGAGGADDEYIDCAGADPVPTGPAEPVTKGPAEPVTTGTAGSGFPRPRTFSSNNPFSAGSAVQSTSAASVRRIPAPLFIPLFTLRPHFLLLRGSFRSHVCYGIQTP